jgi:hypothetical protein
MMQQAWCTALLFFGLCAPALALSEPIELTGLVLDTETKRPLEGAYVIAIYEENLRNEAISVHRCVKLKGMFTGPDGRFHFPVEKLDGESPSAAVAIKPDYYLDRLGGEPDPEAWKRQTGESYHGRLVYLKKQDPSKPELLNFTVGTAACDHARKRDDVAAGVQYLSIAQGELKKYGAKQERIDGLASIIRDLEALPK